MSLCLHAIRVVFFEVFHLVKWVKWMCRYEANWKRKAMNWKQYIWIFHPHIIKGKMSYTIRWGRMVKKRFSQMHRRSEGYLRKSVILKRKMTYKGKKRWKTYNSLQRYFLMKMSIHSIEDWDWMSEKNIAERITEKSTNVLQTFKCSIFLASYLIFSFKKFALNCIAICYVT